MRRIKLLVISKLLQKRHLDMSLVFLNQLVAGLSSLVLLKIFSFYLLPATYGYYALIMSVISLALSLPFNGLNQSVLRFISVYHNERTQYVSYVMSSVVLYLLWLFFYFVIISIVFIFSRNFAWSRMLYPAYLYFFAQVFFNLCIFFYNGNQKRGRAFLLALVASLVNVGLLLYFLLYLGFKEVNLILLLLSAGYLFSSVIIIGRDWYLLYSVAWKIHVSYLKSVYKFAVPLVLMSAFVWFRAMASRWYLSIFVDKAAVATFAVLSSLTILFPTALQSFLVSYFSPIFYKLYDHDKEEALKLLKRISLIFLLFIFLAMIVLYFVADWIILLFSSKYYLTFSWMLAPMFFSFSFYTLISFTVTLKLFAEKKPRKLVLPNVILDIVSLIMGFCGAYWYGLNGAVASFVIMYGLFGIALYVCCW